MVFVFPKRGSGSAEVLRDISECCADDYTFRDGRILHSICSQPLPLAVKAFVQAIHTNLGDSRIFKGVRHIEEKTTQMLGDLLGCPSATGNVVSGGTEANLLALLVAKRQAEKRNLKAPEVVVPFSIHFSVEKAAALLGLKLCFAKLDDRLRVDVQDLAKKINARTVMVMATAGTSEFGTVDLIAAVGTVAKQHGLHFHVDAASGGFIIPFAKELGYALPDFDFKLRCVDSITVDPHKYGLTVIPAGYILFRNRRMQKLISFQSHYVGTPVHTTFLGTRAGASAVSTYAVIKHLGKPGYKKIVKGYFEKRDYLISKLEERGFQLLIPPDLNIVAVKSKNPRKAMQQLEKKGWLVSLSRRYNVLRIVVHHHLTKRHLLKFVELLSGVEKDL